MEDIFSSMRRVVGAGIVFLGLVCIFAPGTWLLTPAHLTFFGVVPREVWGVVHVLLGVLCFWRAASVYALRLFIAIAVTWAAVAFYPISDAQVWNAVSVTAWLTIAGLSYLISKGVSRYEHA